MADSLLTKLEQLQKGISEITARNARLTARNSALEEENANLRRRTDEAEAARHRAELDVEYLRVSHRLAENPDSLVETRRHIAKLIRNIDRCLEMLKE